MMTTYYIFSYGEIIQVMRFERFRKIPQPFEVNFAGFKSIQIKFIYSEKATKFEEISLSKYCQN